MKHLTLISLLAFLIGCSSEHAHHEKSQQKLPVAKVTTAKVQSKQIPVLEIVPGTVQAKNKASISPKVTGDIVEMPIRLGQHVNEDDLLVKISAKEISSRLHQAQASLDKARRDLKREEELLRQGASTPELINDLKIQLRVATAAAEEAETMVGYTEIRAPFAGVITRKNTNEGDLALPGQPLLELEDPSLLRVESYIPEAIALHVKAKDKLVVQIPSQQETFTGTVEEVSFAANPQTRTFLIKIELPKETKARSGQYATVSICGKSKAALVIPQAAIQKYGQIERVFVVQDKHAHLRIIKTADSVNDFVEVLSGLDEQETIVLDGADKLKDGQPVSL
jgi:RND family efflux transporter MFP subunit